MPTFAQFLPTLVTLNTDDPGKLETIASWMTQASPRLAALPGFVDAIQPTWTAQILSNPLGTIRDTAAALGPSGRLAVDATHLARIAQSVQATDMIRAESLDRAAGRPGRQTLRALLGASAADVQWLADEASFLETASAITNRYSQAAQDVVDNWTPPAGQPDTIRYTLLETRTALYPTPNAVQDMAATLRGIHDRLVATLSANATLAAQLRASVPSTPATSEGGSTPPPTGGGTTVTVQPSTNSNAVWWLLGGIAVAGVGVYAITRPATGLARKNPLSKTYAVRVQGDSWDASRSATRAKAENRLRELLMYRPGYHGEIWDVSDINKPVMVGIFPKLNRRRSKRRKPSYLSRRN